MKQNNIEAIDSLSPAQQGMFYETIRVSEPGIHIEQSTYVLSGDLNVGAFQQAWQWIVDRHAILRTSFVWKGQAEPLQVVLRKVQIQIDQQDWRALSSGEQDSRLASYLSADRQQGFKLSQAPLMRLALLQTEEHTWYFVWMYHHILLDGWCHSLILKEFSIGYEAFCQGQAPYLEPCRPYHDYIAWLKQQDLSSAESFWRASLQGFTRPNPLGIEQETPRELLPEKTYGSERFQLSEDVSSMLAATARLHHLTLNTLLQGMWGLLLGRYSAMNDVVFGITVSGRPTDFPGVETIVGLCMNTLPLRIKLTPAASLWSWLAGIQAYNLELRQYEYSSPGDVHRWSDVPGMSLLYESLFVVENYPVHHPEHQLALNIRFSMPENLSTGAQTKYALTFLVTIGAKIGVICVYDKQRFADGAVQQILQHFATLLQYIAANPDVSIGRLQELIPVQQIPVVRSFARSTSTVSEQPYQAPRNPIEEVIMAIWVELLGTSEIGIHDDFFALGGHSLLATQLVARLRAVMQIELPLRSVFEASTVAQLAQRVEQDLQRDGQEFAIPPIVPVARQRYLPLSFAQQRLWFLDQLVKDNPAYNICDALKIKGLLNIRALDRSFQEIVRRHESLRTTFQAVQDQPVQVIASECTFSLPLVDLTALTEERREQEAKHLANQEAREPFQLTRGPLLRATVVRLREDSHMLLASVHHIIFDGWSMAILIRELTTLYAAFSSGASCSLPPLPVQYVDFAVWQREWLQGQVLEAQVQYWIKQLSDLAPLELPTDHPRVARNVIRGARHSLRLPLSLRNELHALSQRQGVTLFMTLLAAYQLLLARYSGQTDIAIGAPIANRRGGEIEGVIGFFANTLVLRTDLTHNPTFQDLLLRVRDTCMRAYTHQDIPFEKLVEVLQPERDLDRSPLFQASIAFQHITSQAQQFAGLTLESVVQDVPSARFDLTLSLADTQDELFCGLEYNADLFEAETIQRMLGHYQMLLHSLVADPQMRIADLPLLSQSEQEQILISWNRTQTDAAPIACVHHLFSAQVQRTPDAIALVFEDQHLSYAQLDRLANQLAHLCLSRGVRPREMVGLCLTRSLELFIGILAILKAGGVYVPLDPAYPPDRLAYMLDDARPALVLTSRETAQLVAGSVLPQCCLPREWWQLAEQPCAAPLDAITAADGAYVIYTSGSTGKPKGVLVAHRGLGNLAYAQQEGFGVHAYSHVLQFASLSFDASVSEFAVTLLAGATLYLAPQMQLMPGPDLLRILREWAITVVTLPPTALSVLPLDPLPQLETLVVAGEACPPDLARQWGQGRRFVNAYGPTEATVCASLEICEATSQPLSIGRPIANTQIYLLDDYLQPVPVGVPGEMFIGGLGLAQGYLHRPDLTAERFIPHPFVEAGAAPDRAGQRLYRTGDRARWRPDGRLDFLGRLDNQVKIRGYRIELDEIEAVLSQHPAIQSCVAHVYEEQAELKTLIAYVVPQPEAQITGHDVRDYLQNILPDYMVPSSILLLESLPLTSNGKVDRQRLPAPSASQPDGSPAEVQILTPVQEVIAGLFADLLELPWVPLEESFFALGGHSLLATRLLARLQQLLQVELPLRHLFEASSVRELANCVEEALREQQGLRRPALLPASREQPLPLSFAQQRLWFLEQFAPDSPTYLIPQAVRLHGPFAVQALARSLRMLLERHESLRTRFVAQTGQPVQVIASCEQARLVLPVVDLTALPVEQREAVALTLASQEAGLPFELQRWPLLRVTLLRSGAQEHLLLLTLHHIVADGWSMSLLVRELVAGYNAALEGRTPELPALPVQYADVALWQREWLQGEVLERQLSYWKAHLAGVVPLELPTDLPRPLQVGFAGARERVRFPLELLHDLQELSQQEGVTLFMTLLAAFQVVLARYSGQEDIVVGTPIANRTQEQTEGLIGFFVNTLVLRTDLSGPLSFQELLRRVREVTLGAYTHQDVPFEHLVEALQPQRDLSRTPLFQVMFSYQQETRAETEMRGVRLERVEQETASSKFDLTLALAETSRGLEIVLEYRTELFVAETIKRLLGHYGQVLKAVVANREEQVASISLLTAAERTQILSSWNNTRVPYPDRSSLHQLFEEQVERAPDRIALIFQEEQISASCLNRRANQLAHYLHIAGIAPHTLVGVGLERSLDLVIAILAILKVGGAYVPLDPAYPMERLAYMLKDTNAPVLLTHQSVQARLPDHQAQIICLDTLWPTIACLPAENPAYHSYPDDLAYVMYTSGSTGLPKGICISHQAVVRLAKNNTFARFQPEDVFLLLAPISFDASTLELWASLLNGARLVVAPAGALSLEELSQILSRYQVTLLWLTAGLFHLMVEHHLAVLTAVPQVLAGGDVLSPHLVSKFLRAAERSCLINGYGPTENTTFTCCHPMYPTQQEIQHVPIGRPIANTYVYLLDAAYQPVPVGVAGELYTGGDGLAQGYLGRPDWTAERFVPDPFSSLPGARLYRTGDLARYRSDGTIEFLGRRDFQVKLRGYRIEIGEIETVLQRLEGVQDSLVTVYEDQSGDKQLVAYLVQEADNLLSVEKIRRSLSEQLPDYMVPTSILLLDSLPLTSNGKVDRQRLPAPSASQPDGSPAEAQMLTPVQEVIAGLFADLLELPWVPLEESFFALGGHSLLATRLLARLQQLLQVELPLRHLFEASSVRELAACVEEALREQQGLRRPALLPASREQPLPLSFAQQRLWFLEQFAPDSPTYLIPQAVRLHGPFVVQALARSLRMLLERHESLRTRFVAQAGQPVQVIASCEQARLVLPVVDLTALPQEQREAVALKLASQEASLPFELQRWPLLRVTLLRSGPQEHLLLLTLHHIVADGWSMSLLVRELVAGYNAALEGRTPELPALPVQYADVALWQREWLQGEVLERQLSYWKAHLAGVVPLELPTDLPRPLQVGFAGARERVRFPLELLHDLQELSQQEGVTLFMTLLAAFQVVLARYSGQEDIVVGTPIANRTQEQTEGLIGFFVNTLVLRTDLSGPLSFQELLRRVREVTLGAYTHQDVPFEHLVEALQPQRDLSRTPLFQVMFSYQQETRAETEMRGVRLERVEQETASSKFDLTMALAETSRGLEIVLEYRTELFVAETIKRLLGHYGQVLKAVVANREEQVASISLLTAAERTQILSSWNPMQEESIPAACLHQLFEEQVERAPDRIALIFQEEQISASCLNRRANQLAHYLRAQGVGPNVLVGLCLERSLDVLVGILAILKAGGAYVPLDPAYPPDRLAFMLADARTSLLLTQDHLLERFPVLSITSFCLDRDWALLSAYPCFNPVVPGLSPDNLAYIIYTSGSTGTPKGCMISHDRVLHLFEATRPLYQFQQDDCWSCFHSFAFDFSVWEIWGALLYGARLLIVSSRLARSTDAFYDLLSQQGVTMLSQTPSAFRQLVWWDAAHGQTSSLALRCVIFGGEALDVSSVQQWFVRHSDTQPQLVNMYGITETTVHVTACPLTQENIQQGSGTPIGHPLAGWQAYVLDQHLQLLPAGVPGELYIGGCGLAQGYLWRPELTALRFVPHPFASQPGQRLYRTGDLARWRADGALEYLGRIDHQVKLRGFRIELGEIESALNQHPDVHDSIVLLRQLPSSDQQLVAYVVPEKPDHFHDRALREYLQRSLPDYMLPSIFVLMDALPLTPHGKVDRRALPDPQPVETVVASNQQRLTPVQEVIAGLFSNILGRTHVPVQESFFDLGGHSLLATQLVTRLRQALRVELPLRSVFEAPSVNALAACVEQALQRKPGVAIPPLLPGPRGQDLPLSFAQQRLWFLDQLEPGNTAYIISLSVQIEGVFHLRLFEESLKEVIRRHESLRTTFTSRRGHAVQIVHRQMLFSLPVIDLSCLPQEQRLSQAEALVKAGEQQAFDLERGPLLRASLLRLEANVHVLLLSMHHIISDAWSLTILRHEIFTLYDALSHEKPAPLVPLALQYADFALWQRQWLQGDVLQGHLDYWQKQLRGAVPVELPADHQRPLVRSLRGATLSFRLPANLSSALLALSRSQDVTLFMTLLAAFQILLSRYTGQTDIVVGTDIANRTQIETEQMIGFFINLLALRTRLHGMPTFHSLLHQVRDMVLDAYTHQDLPFDMLVDSLQLVRQRNQTPLVQVLFVLQNTPHSSAELPGLQLAPFGGSVTTAKFDIALFMWEGSNGLGGMVNYSTDLFEESTISTLVERFTVLLQEIVAQPDALIETLGIATPEEKRQQHRKVSDLYSANRKELHISRGEEIDLTSLALWMDD